MFAYKTTTGSAPLYLNSLLQTYVPLEACVLKVNVPHYLSCVLSDGRIHKGIDIVCGDYGIVNAPFSGNLGGPVGRALFIYLSSVHCVKIFNIRPYVFFGSVVQGEAMGYLLPLQERFSGITSHLELQMCDGSDPSPFI
uniref:Si:ch1073-204b8.1 n=1 Tax=Sinocyclocheilus rhinocerous TaxID=307959 RepID=A0A673HDR2_9TELE